MKMVNEGHGELQAAAPVTLAVKSCKFIQQQFSLSSPLSFWPFFVSLLFISRGYEGNVERAIKRNSIFGLFVFLFFSMFILFDGNSELSFV